jgi:hypothetical protein
MFCISLAVKYYHVFVAIHYDTKAELKSTVQLIKRRRFHTDRTNLQYVSLSVVECDEFDKRCAATCPVSDMSGFLFPLIHARHMHKRKEGWKKVIFKVALSLITTFPFTQHFRR